jgi:hypothetical protein
LLISEILEALYAPHKAFKEIIQNPRYIGPLVIILLFVVANLGFTYAAISKTYIEQTLPAPSAKLDEWTENRTFWASNAAVAESDDSINGTYYGNKSIAFTIVDATDVWGQLQNIETVNCSGLDGFKKLSFRIKWTSPEARPADVAIYMLSTNSDYFYQSLTESFVNSTYNVWNNETSAHAISLASEGWNSNGTNPDWGSIAGVRLDFKWSANSNITLLVDGLFFHGVSKSLFETAGTAYLLNYTLVAVMQFVISWVLLGGLIYVMTKGLGGKLVWKPLLIVIGFALITMVVQATVNAVAYANLSTVNYPFELIGGVSGETDAAYNKILDQTWLVTQIGRYTQIAVYIWTIALCSLAVRLLAVFSWTKSFLVGTVAYLITILVEGFILG